MFYGAYFMEDRYCSSTNQIMITVFVTSRIFLLYNACHMHLNREWYIMVDIAYVRSLWSGSGCCCDWYQKRHMQLLHGLATS